jgi:hypothetical protein
MTSCDVFDVPVELVDQHRETFPGIDACDVPGTSHCAIVMAPEGARAVADALDDVRGAG